LKIQNRIGEKYGFVITSHKYELSGYCPQCAQGNAVQKACRPSGRGRRKNRKN
jgi:hypothetical protein